MIAILMPLHLVKDAIHLAQQKHNDAGCSIFMHIGNDLNIPIMKWLQLSDGKQTGAMVAAGGVY